MTTDQEDPEFVENLFRATDLGEAKVGIRTDPTAEEDLIDRDQEAHLDQDLDMSTTDRMADHLKKEEMQIMLGTELPRGFQLPREVHSGTGPQREVHTGAELRREVHTETEPQREAHTDRTVTSREVHTDRMIITMIMR